jgi:signal peptidase I
VSGDDAEAQQDRTDARKRGRRGRPKKRTSFWKELPILVLVALVLTFLIQTFLAKVYVIPSGSMETTLHGCPGCTDDRVVVDKITYRFTDPAPGDVVVFRGSDGWTSEVSIEEPSNPLVRGLQLLGSLVGFAPPDENDFVKRVIAVGGQTVACCDQGRVTVDGKPLNEPYVSYEPDNGPQEETEFGPVVVPKGQLWMMGDRRNNSADSRVPGHGPVPVANVIGKVRLIILPVGRFGWVDAIDPHSAAVGMGMLGVMPFALRRRRERDRNSFLPGGP